jgi:hypothetical protein
MMEIRVVALLVVAGLCTGCASFTSPAREHELDEGKTH